MAKIKVPSKLPIKEIKCKDVYGQEYVLSYTDAPMVEYAPIVRCKDCKHWFHDSKLHGDDNGEWRYGECQSDEGFDSPIQKCFLTRETWFCADGEVATVKDGDSKDSGDVIEDGKEVDRSIN